VVRAGIIHGEPSPFFDRSRPMRDALSNFTPIKPHKRAIRPRVETPEQRLVLTLVAWAVFAAAALVAASPARANEVILFNQSTHYVYIATQIFEPASQTHCGYDSWVTHGWFVVAPGKAIAIDSGQSSMFWLRETYDSWTGPPLYWPNVSVGSAYVNFNGFRLESPSTDNGLFPGWVVAPGSPHWVYNASQISALGWKFFGAFNHLHSNGLYYISGPKTIHSQTLPFGYTAKWNETIFMDQQFQPPPGANVVYYTYSVGSSQGVDDVHWSDPFNSARGPVLTGSVSGSGDPLDRGRGFYSGTVTIYYSYP
jgi:hypothetical protein